LGGHATKCDLTDDGSSDRKRNLWLRVRVLERRTIAVDVLQHQGNADSPVTIAEFLFNSSEPEVRAKEWHRNHPLNDSHFWFAAKKLKWKDKVSEDPLNRSHVRLPHISSVPRRSGLA